MLPSINQICNDLIPVLGFKPNNCLINYYIDGKSKMGFHSDQVDILEPNTGIAIISLGATRTLRFRNINKKDDLADFNLVSGSLFYMTQNIQHVWEHSLLKSADDNSRMSLTFRKIIS